MYLLLAKMRRLISLSISNSDSSSTDGIHAISIPTPPASAVGGEEASIQTVAQIPMKSQEYA